MAGTLNQAELLKLFPHKTLPTIAHGRSRARKTKTKKMAHGRSRSHLPTAATRDPFQHKGQAKGQG